MWHEQIFGHYSEFRHSTPNLRCGIYFCQRYSGALVPIVASRLGYVDLKSDCTSMLLPEMWLLLLEVPNVIICRQGRAFLFLDKKTSTRWMDTFSKEKNCGDGQVGPLAFVVYGRAYLSPATRTNVFEGFGYRV